MKKTESKNIRLDLYMFALTFGVQAIISFILTPIYSVFAADYIYRATIFTDIIRTLIDVFDVAAMTVGFSILAVAAFMGHKKFKYVIIYLGAVLFRRLGSIATTLIINHALEFDEIMMSLSVFALDIVLLLTTLLIVILFSRSYRKSLAMSSDEPILFNADAVKTDISKLYPFKKIYSRHNMLQVCLLTIGILLSAVKLISRTFAIIIESTESVMLTIGGYVGDVLIIIISYAISCFLLSWLYGRNEKKKALQKIYED